jgi:ATP-binding cassette subfamily C protein CydC
MTALLQIARKILAVHPRALLRGLMLSVVVLAMGLALLSVSGWFITATALAGLAGVGAVFNVFIPSAMIRLLALGRTAARYGERVLTHDATLRALSGLRVNVMQGMLRAPWRKIEALRAASALNRLTADIDALDGVLLRLILPAMAGLIVQLIALIALWVFVHPSVAVTIGLGYTVLPTLAFWLGQRRALAPARKTEAALQAFRTRLIDLIAAKDDLTVYGQLGTEQARVSEAQTRHSLGRARLDQIERRTGFALDLSNGAVIAATMALGASLVSAGDITAPQAAIGIFAALALTETIAPIRRALSEFGRMQQAAKRVVPAMKAIITPPQPLSAPGPARIRAQDLTYCATSDSPPMFAPISFELRAGESLALTGPSGSGKSTILLMAAGELPPAGGQLSVHVGEIATNGLSTGRVMVPQRHALLAGTIEENLRLARPEASEDDIWTCLQAVSLDHVVQEKGGLQAHLGFRGDGLSGGEGRRLALARAILARPSILLLDEPTEGLDGKTAASVLSGLRSALPDTAILIAAHRPAELEFADHQVSLTSV